MPTWKIHNKWAQKLGISEEILDYINNLIDFPEKCQEFSEYQREIYRIEHDSGRKRKTVMYLQMDLLEEKGPEFVKTWFLHHALDYIQGAPILTVEEVLRRLTQRTKECPELKMVKDFINKNFEGILQDCRGE